MTGRPPEPRIYSQPPIPPVDPECEQYQQQQQYLHWQQ
jgi:hypothetical protein